MADGFTTTRSVPMPVRWGEKRYHSLDYALKSQFGEKVYRIALNGGMTCPNRDGKIGRGGCIFCSGMGSGDFAGSASFSICEQLAAGKAALQAKRPVHSYIAYFQAFTNTYAPVEYLEKIFTEAILDPDVQVLAVATRPDCLSHETVELLRRLNQIKPVWIELGLQTIHEKTARFIRRGYELPCFEKAVHSLATLDIPVIVHLILGLPGETDKDMYASVSYLNTLPVSGVKLQLLHILKGTDLADLYERDPASICLFPDRDDYLAVLIRCLMLLSPDIVVHRVTGDGSRSLLTAPLWSLDKRGVLNALHKQMREQNAFQGALFPGSSSDESIF